MEENCRILYIIDQINHLRAGTEQQLARLIEGLDRKLYDIYLHCLKPSDWIKSAEAKMLNCTISVGKTSGLLNPFFYLDFLKLVGQIRSLSPHIVHTFFPDSNIWGVLAAKMAGVKHIISSRRDYGQWMDRRNLFFTRFANRFVSSVHVNSTKVKELTEVAEGVNGDKIHVIYNGVDTREFRKRLDSNHPDFRTTLGIYRANRIVGCIANLRPMKHLSTLIMAAAEVVRRRDNISFVLVGDGPSRGQLQELVDELGIGQAICFAGSQPDIFPYLKEFDVGVNCSVQEGTSNAIIECMLAGVPCIVSRSGGNEELIQNRWNGYTFPLDDHITLASLILDLIDDEKTKQIFRDRSRDYVEKHMSLDRMIDGFSQYYLGIGLPYRASGSRMALKSRE